MRRLAAVAVLAAGLLLSAHVGSPDVWFDGRAGPYPVRVIVRMPGVVPGLAEVIVRVRGGGGDERVLVSPAHWETGPEGAPPPDVAAPVRGEPELYSARIWLMARGTYRITVRVEGGRGDGAVVVPVVARATERLAMRPGTGLALAGGGVFLFVGLLTLVGAAVRESVLPPGVAPDRRRIRRARWATAVAALVVAALLFGGWRWWSAVDAAHRARLDRPWSAAARVLPAPGDAQVLRLQITDSLWVQRNDSATLARFGRPIRTPLIPDHGKLMHLFVVREPDLAGFAHLHPVSTDSVHFDVALPPLPPGRYTAYGDIVQESGTSHTLVAEFELPRGGAPSGDRAGGGAPDRGDGAAPGTATIARAPDPDPDDAWWAGAPLGRLTAADYRFDDGALLRLHLPDRVVVGQEVELRAELLAPDGTPAPIRPYMGMRGHAAVRRDDGAVFVHLHPTGTISMAAQMVLALRQPAGSAESAGSADAAESAHSADERLARRARAGVSPHGMHAAGSAPGVVVFPYAFPRPGRYRVWIQVLEGPRVRTGAWDLVVAGADGA